MSVRTSILKPIFILVTICSLVLVTFVPLAGADTTMLTQPGFTKGVTWKPYIAMKKTTFVDYDTESYLDDYAYLAAVPTTVFYDEYSDTVYTNPLLFFEDEYPIEEFGERALNARQGIDYFIA